MSHIDIVVILRILPDGKHDTYDIDTVSSTSATGSMGPRSCEYSVYWSRGVYSDLFGVLGYRREGLRGGSNVEPPYTFPAVLLGIFSTGLGGDSFRA